MTSSVLWLSQVQFFLSLGFMLLFLVIELGLAWALLYFKIRAHGSAQAGWTAAYRFWVRVFALAVILTLASSMPVLIQLGGLWPSLMDKIGEVAGPLLAAAILTTFIFRSCFLGAMLFGQRHLSDRVHTAIVLMVALGALLAAFWMVALLAWMQTPAGALLVDGRYYVADWYGVLFNPSVGWYGGLLVLTAILTVAFLMLGVTTGHSFRRPLDESERLVFRTALLLAMAGVVLYGLVAAGTARMVAQHQPAKAAATAGYWDSGSPPGIVVFAWPDSAKSRNRYVWEWPVAGAEWLARDARGQLRGLDQFAGMRPPVALTFWSYRIAAFVGLLMVAASWLTAWRLRKKLCDPAALPRIWRRMLCGMTFSGWALSLAGLSHVLFGLYPYAVNETVTLSEIAGPAAPGVVLGGLFCYVAVYALLLTGFMQMLRHVARYGVVPVTRRRGRA